MTIGEAHIVQVPYQEEEPFRARRTGRGAGPGARRQYSFQTRVSLFRVTAAAAHLVPFDGDIDPASVTGESVVVVNVAQEPGKYAPPGTAKEDGSRVDRRWDCSQDGDKRI